MSSPKLLQFCLGLRCVHIDTLYVKQYSGVRLYQRQQWWARRSVRNKTSLHCNPHENCDKRNNTKSETNPKIEAYNISLFKYGYQFYQLA